MIHRPIFSASPHEEFWWNFLSSFRPNFSIWFYCLLIPVAARSKAWVCGPSLAGIVGSNHAGWMDVCLLWATCVVSWKISASDWSLVRRRPTDYGASSEFHRKTPKDGAKTQHRVEAPHTAKKKNPPLRSPQETFFSAERNNVSNAIYNSRYYLCMFGVWGALPVWLYQCRQVLYWSNATLNMQATGSARTFVALHHSTWFVQPESRRSYYRI